MKLLSLFLLVLLTVDAFQRAKRTKKLPTVDLKKSRDLAEARKLSLVTRSTPRKRNPLPPHVRDRLLRRRTRFNLTERLFSKINGAKRWLKLKETFVTELSMYLDETIASMTLSYLACLAFGIDNAEVQKKIGGALGGLSVSEIESLSVDPSKVVTKTALKYSASALSEIILKAALDCAVDGALGIPVWAAQPIIFFSVRKILEKCM